MFNFLSSCGLCSNIPQGGDFAYEVFNKVPTVGGIFGNLSQVIGNFGPIGNIGGIGNLIGGVSNLIGNRGGQAQPGQGGFDFTKFVNNVPMNSLVATDSTFKELSDNNSNVVIKKVLKSNYSQLIKEHQESGQKFTDTEFPPDQSSIGDVEDLKMTATWKRIPDVIKNPEFISNKIDSSDILQGSLGDCYFLSAISALAENDFRVKNLFPNLEINRSGIYMARILYKGVIREVVVDDYIPVNQQGDPLFAKPAGGREIWVMILEKCWAKLHGSYGAIVGGLPNEVLHAFSGAPTEYNQVPSNKPGQDTLWNKMWQAYSKGGILCCGTKGDDDVEKYGFVKGHAYTILNIYQQPYKMLKIRNPWGEKEWQGRASDSDRQFWNSISPNDKQRMEFTQKNDGIFFMLWEDFVNYYDMVDICKINDNASFSSIEAEFDRKRGEIFQFETNGGNLTISLSQQSLRGSDPNVEARGYARSAIIVAKYQQAASGYEYKYINSSSNRLFAEHNLELIGLQKGIYVVYAKYDWINHNPDTASINLYTESPTHIEKSKQSKHSNFLYKVFLDHARNNSKKQVIGNNEWICNDMLLSQCGYGYLAVHLDQNSKRKLGIQLNESQYTQKRFILKKPYRGRGIIKASVEPGKQMIIIFRIKSQNFPSSVNLPNPKIYNLV